MLFNSEVWYGLKQGEIEILKKIDETYMRQLFGAHSKTAIEAFYLESGKMPLRFIIQNRRLMYWWHLVKLNDNNMLYNFYNAQTGVKYKFD